MSLEGTRELGRKLKALGKAAEGKVLRQAVRAGAQPVMAHARATVPKGTEPHKTHKGRVVAPGFASRSLTTVTKIGRRKDRAFAFIGVKAEAYYVLQFVELGTSRQAAQPWLVPAFESTQKAQQQALAAKLRQAIMKAAKGQTHA